MAIGDAIAVILGAATTNRQPAAGVEEQISAMSLSGTTDSFNAYDGTNEVGFMKASATDVTSTSRNAAMMITNSVYLRKSGTTDRGYAGGVQTNV
jgi:poly(3-hydroxybutyrate) depolymerase